MLRPIHNAVVDGIHWSIKVAYDNAGFGAVALFVCAGLNTMAFARLETCLHRLPQDMAVADSKETT